MRAAQNKMETGRKSRRIYDKEYLSVPAVYCPQGARWTFQLAPFLPHFFYALARSNGKCAYVLEPVEIEVDGPSPSTITCGSLGGWTWAFLPTARVWLSLVRWAKSSKLQENLVKTRCQKLTAYGQKDIIKDIESPMKPENNPRIKGSICETCVKKSLMAHFNIKNWSGACNGVREVCWRNMFSWVFEYFLVLRRINFCVASSNRRSQKCVYVSQTVWPVMQWLYLLKACPVRC